MAVVHIYIHFVKIVGLKNVRESWNISGNRFRDICKDDTREYELNKIKSGRLQWMEILKWYVSLFFYSIACIYLLCFAYKLEKLHINNKYDFFSSYALIKLSSLQKSRAFDWFIHSTLYFLYNIVIFLLKWWLHFTTLKHYHTVDCCLDGWNIRTKSVILLCINMLYLGR